MKYPRRRILWLIGCFLAVLAGAVAATLRSIYQPPVSEVATTKSQPGALKSAKPQFQQPQTITPQAIGPIDPHVVAGGGGTSTGGNFRVDGTVGEVGAATPQSGGQFILNGGFWNTLSAAAGTPTPTPSPTPTATPTPTPTPPLNIAQFSAANYDVQEACTTVTITVNRVGDTSAPASIDYRSSDFTATERRDYITALGTLNFAAGETSKSLAVLINDDSFVEGNETFNITLSNPTGMTLSAPAITTVTINDNPTEPATNVIDDPRTYVCQHYHDFLNRQPDPSGWDFWTNQIIACGSNVQCTEVRRIDVSASFFLSIEFQQTGYLVERFYKVAFADAMGTSTFGSNHQLPVPIVRFSEFLKDTQRIGQGVVVLQPGWEQLLENNKQAYALEFVQTSRFSSSFPASMTPAQFVDKLNQNAGNALSASERTTAINLFGGAADTSNPTARAQAIRQVADDSDLYNAEYNRAFVLAEYFGYLRRNPNDAPESTLDYTGYDFWLTKLNQFDGNYINAEMVKAFLSSIEYRQRFGP